MSNRLTIITLLLAAFGIASMLMVMRAAPRTGSAEVHTAGGGLLSNQALPVDKVSRITVRRRDQPALVFERSVPEPGSAEPAGWLQKQPFEYPMDMFSMRQLAAVAAELRDIDIIEASELGGDLSAATLALDPPEAEVQYEWEGGSLTLQLGRRGIAGRAYVRLGGEQRIHVTGNQLHERVLDTDPREWRDRTIFRNVSIESDRIERRDGSGVLVLERDVKRWRMLEPAATRVDSDARDAFLTDLGRAVIGGFILDQPPDLASFGLKEPAATVTVVNGAGVQRLLIGTRLGATGEDRFGMLEGRPTVVKVPEAALRRLLRQPGDLVEPTGSGAQAADVKSIRISTSDGEVRFERDLERWLAASHGGREVRPELVNELLEQLTHVRATEVAFQQYPRDLEVGTVTLFGFDAKALDTVRIAREKETGKWAMENGDNVLRVFPASMQLRLTAGEYGL